MTENTTTQVSFPDGVEVLLINKTPIAAFIPSIGLVKISKYFYSNTPENVNNWARQVKKTHTEKVVKKDIEKPMSV